MKNKTNIISISAIIAILFFATFEIGFSQRRGGSFGGFRSRGSSSFRPSGGGSSFFRRTTPSAPRNNSFTPTPVPSFGGNTRRTTNSGNNWTTTQTQRPSFSGRAMSSPTEYTRNYGVPRKVERYNNTSTTGGGNYVVNHYGGYGDNFLTGYLAGRTSFWWSTPFHPAYYYSRPHYYPNPDGTIAVYPPTFSIFSVFSAIIWFGIICLGIFIVYKLFFKKNNSSNSNSSFSSFG